MLFFPFILYILREFQTHKYQSYENMYILYLTVKHKLFFGPEIKDKCNHIKNKLRASLTNLWQSEHTNNDCSWLQQYLILENEPEREKNKTKQNPAVTTGSGSCTNS